LGPKPPSCSPEGEQQDQQTQPASATGWWRRRTAPLLHFSAQVGGNQRFMGFVFKPFFCFFRHDVVAAGGLKVEKIIQFIVVFYEVF
jgi:hypothetical protein